VHGLGGNPEGLCDGIPAPPIASSFTDQLDDLVLEGLEQRSDRVQRVCGASQSDSLRPPPELEHALRFLDVGEHDGVDGRYGTSQAFNGPSDGGALVFNWHPGEAATWTPQDAPTNPIPVADAGGGGCADGTCFSAQTRQRTVYNGTGSAPSRDVYNYQGKQFDPYNCSSGDAKSEQSCHGGARPAPGHQRLAGRRGPERQRRGVQVYEDPDPQGSPAGPSQLYPLPALYAGTCGVVAGGGAAKAPASPVTNGAGQVVVAPTGC
jgi:hypothetical protein